MIANLIEQLRARREAQAVIERTPDVEFYEIARDFAVGKELDLVDIDTCLTDSGQTESDLQEMIAGLERRAEWVEQLEAQPSPEQIDEAETACNRLALEIRDVQRQLGGKLDSARTNLSRLITQHRQGEIARHYLQRKFVHPSIELARKLINRKLTQPRKEAARLKAGVKELDKEVARIGTFLNPLLDTKPPEYRKAEHNQRVRELRSEAAGCREKKKPLVAKLEESQAEIATLERQLADLNNRALSL